MTIEITRIDELYHARLSPPHGGGRPWESSKPLTRSELIKELLSRGCHQIDIGDALNDLDKIPGNNVVKLD